MTQTATKPNDIDSTRRQISGLRDRPGQPHRIFNNPALEAQDTTLVAVSDGVVEVSFAVGPQAVQGNGVVGGGTLANLLDASLAIAVMSKLEEGTLCSTVSLTVNMMRAAAPGAFRARATVSRMGRKIAFADAQLFDGEGRMVASATSSLAILPI